MLFISVVFIVVSLAFITGFAISKIIKSSKSTAQTPDLSNLRPIQQSQEILQPTAKVQNTSGLGKNSMVPEEVKGWSWGPFFWNWIWAWGNRVWFVVLLGILVFFLQGFFVGMISFTGGVGSILLLIIISALLLFGYNILLGIKGKEWAWRARKWDSVEQFNEVQKKWAFWGVVVIGTGVGLFLLEIFIIAFSPRG